MILNIGIEVLNAPLDLFQAFQFPFLSPHLHRPDHLQILWVIDLYFLPISEFHVFVLLSFVHFFEGHGFSAIFLELLFIVSKHLKSPFEFFHFVWLLTTTFWIVIAQNLFDSLPFFFYITNSLQLLSAISFKVSEISSVLISCLVLCSPGRS